MSNRVMTTLVKTEVMTGVAEEMRPPQVNLTGIDEASGDLTGCAQLGPGSDGVWQRDPRDGFEKRTHLTAAVGIATDKGGPLAKTGPNQAAKKWQRQDWVVFVGSFEPSGPSAVDYWPLNPGRRCLGRFGGISKKLNGWV